MMELKTLCVTQCCKILHSHLNASDRQDASSILRIHRLDHSAINWPTPATEFLHIVVLVLIY